MKHLVANTISIVTALVVSAVAVYPAASAAPAPSNPADTGQALEIAPPVIYLSGNPGQTVTTRIYLRDISSSDLVVKGQVNDFIASGEDGTPKVLLKDIDNNPYSLKDWVSTPDSLTLVPKEIKTMNVTFKVPADASPGGHYGVIRFTATAPSLNDTGVSLSASLGALVLFTVNGKINHDLAIKEFSANHGGSGGTVLESGPVNFVVHVRNAGNVHEQPTGQVSVTDMFNRKVGAVNVNSPPRNILPGSIRKFEQALDKSVIGDKKLFGRYKAELKLTYGNPDRTITASTVFWVIPYRLIAALAIALVALFFILRSALRRYNRRIIEKARSGDQGSGKGDGGVVGEESASEPAEAEETPEPEESAEPAEEPAEEEPEKPEESEAKKKKSSKRKK